MLKFIFEYVLPISFVGLGVNTIYGLVHFAQLTRMLKVRHPDTWRMLGEPSLVRNNTPVNGLKTQRFIFKGEYRSLNDPDITRLAGRSKISAVAQLVLFAVASAAMFIAGA